MKQIEQDNEKTSRFTGNRYNKMALIISSKTASIDTMKEVLKQDASELWEKDQECTNKLLELQKSVVKALPSSKELLTSNKEQLTQQQLQVQLLGYIKLRSLYSFADKLWKTIDERCQALAKAINSQDRYSEEDVKKEIEDIFNVVKRLDADSLTNDSVTGFFRLSNIVSSISPRMDFNVMKVYPHNAVWTFFDIVGSINGNGIHHDGSLWNSALNDDFPTSPSIGELIANDDTVHKN